MALPARKGLRKESWWAGSLCQSLPPQQPIDPRADLQLLPKALHHQYRVYLGGPQPLTDGATVPLQIVQIDPSLVCREYAVIDLALLAVRGIVMRQEHVSVARKGMHALARRERHVHEERLLSPPFRHRPKRVEQGAERRRIKGIEYGEVEATEDRIVSSPFSWCY